MPNDDPKSSHLIFLIGMPGAGKTYWGEKIAAHFGLRFVDLDALVAANEKASIQALFATYGENGFRERENKWLVRLIKDADKSPVVVACGGGTPCFLNNLEIMKAAGCVIYLDTGVPELVRRLNESNEVRPLLRGRGDLAAYLESLLGKRQSIYKQAHYTMHTNLISRSNFDQIISTCINRH